MSGKEKWEHLKIPFADIKDATKGFMKEIGTGGYGSVYEGKLLVNGEYMKVAVKRSNEKHGQGLKEFLTEIDLLWDQKHTNIITLIGYCDEGNEKIIVYEFAERGSLDYYFRFRNASYALTWLQRLKIVVDVARGLDHLHHHLQNKKVIIHRDIKSSNILLDHNWVAKISDFGLSKSTFSGLDRSTVVTQACGTPGYVEPELKQILLANKKADVFSFGMVLFEVLCGRLCKRPYDDGIILSAEVAEEYYAMDKLDNIIDPIVKEQMNPNVLRKFSTIAINCLMPRGRRPSMDAVKKELEESLNIQVFDSTPAHSLSKRNPLKIPFQVIKDATKDFKKVIGRGGYGTVYLGELSTHGIYTKVAVNRSDEEFGQGIMEFLKEIDFLQSLRHENIITLVGYCDEGKEKIIVYEYAEHGSLDQYITGSNTNYTLTWLERLKIVVDVARGLDYLQKNQIIIHRDMKSSNIWLDHTWVAKISQFGLDADFIGSEAYGYMDPEYFDTGMLTKGLDVYSFGMLLFEVLCGRLCNSRDKDGLTLSQVAKEYYANGKLDRISDPILREQMSPESLSKFSAIAYKCLLDRKNRPPIHVVKKELEETLKIEVHRWRSFISRHWYILNVEHLSPKSDTVHEETDRSKSLSVSCDADITDKDVG